MQAEVRFADRTTYIYGLIDPRNAELRYIGKTVLDPRRRVAVHRWRSTRQRQKRHSMAWIAGLEAAGLRPEVETIEVVEPGFDWVEAEQFWIAYFRSIGCRLCNLTAGGEGQTGYRQQPESIEARVAKMRGPLNPNFGKPMPENTRAALMAGGAALRADPVRKAKADAARRAGMTPEILAAGTRRLLAAMSNPDVRRSAQEKASQKNRTPEARERVSRQSKDLWLSNGDQIIAAQNAGKGDAWRAAQSKARSALWADPNNKMAAAKKALRKLSDIQIEEIRRRLKAGESQSSIASKYKLSQSMISRINSGSRY